MGLYIYVRWGEVDEKGNYVGWHEESGRWHDYYINYITGSGNVPESGYLCESWGGLEWVYEVAKKHSAPNPLGFFPEWSLYAPERPHTLDLSGDRLDEVLVFRDDTLIPWLARSVSTLDDLKGEERREFQAFRQRIRDVIGFINFIQCHRDKPNLAVVFS